MRRFWNIKIDKIRINGTGFFLCAISYLYISIIIFLIGWTKYIVSIPISLLLLFAIYEYYKKYKEYIQNRKPIYIHLKMFLALCFIIIFLGGILGWTGFANQALDYAKHNAVLSDLVNQSWPVYYENAGETSMLTYYLGQYMVPSVIGKMFSSANLAIFFNGIWAMLGMLIAVLGIFKITKADTTFKQVITLIISLFFSTCIVLSQTLGKLIITNQDMGLNQWFINNDMYKLQYSSNLVLLRWVFPQCIVPWIIFSILYENYFDIEHYIILCLPILFFSAFPFISIVFMLIVLVILYGIRTKNIKLLLRKIFSPSNIIVGITLGGMLLFYFFGNVLEQKPEDIALQVVRYMGENILVYICFIISFLPYTVILFKANKNNPFYWMSTVILLILPFFKMGLYNDFCMRVSIIPLFIYMILTIQKVINEMGKISKIAIIVVLLIGSVSAVIELYTAIDNISLRFIAGDFKYSLRNGANRNADWSSDVKYNYYAYDLENSIFCKYLAKK